MKSVLIRIFLYLVQNLLFRRHLDDGEKIFEILHKHPYEVFHSMLLWIILGFFPPILLTLYARSEGYFFSWWWAVSWILFSFTWFSYRLIDWYFDVLIITNRSLLHIQWHGFFDKESSRIEYEDIKEVSYSISGMIATSMDFGDLSILSVSGGKTLLKNTPHPQKADMMIRNYKQEFIRFNRFTEASSLEEILNEMVRNHVWKYGTKHGFLPRR